MYWGRNSDEEGRERGRGGEGRGGEGRGGEGRGGTEVYHVLQSSLNVSPT